MRSVISQNRDLNARLAFWLLAGLLIVLWFAGGASRADVAGQAVTRLFAWVVVIVFVIRARMPDLRPLRALFVLFGLSVAVVACQLIPLPPAIWSALPGHEMLLRAAEVTGQPQPWRPLSIAPSATANALASLVVPGSVLLLCANLTRRQHWTVARLLLGLVLAGSFVALVQVSGANYSNPLINHVSGSISGNFANRNHFALFVAVGCLLASVIGAARDDFNRWLAFGAMLLIPFFALVILAVGSRAGLVLTVLAIVMGLAIGQANLRNLLRALPKPAAIGLTALALAGVTGIVGAAIVLDRAESVDRALSLEASADLRRQALPHVIEATQSYFPTGAGFGTFDQAYRIVEPDALLRLTYFNHAHNDWIETVLSGGLAGALLLVAMLAWFATAVWRMWCSREGIRGLSAVGAGILLLFMIASLFDYPARTPMGMTLVVLAAVWLQRGRDDFGAHTSPRERA